MPENPRVIPLSEALAALDTPEAVEERTRRAEKRFEEMYAESGPGRRSIVVDPLARLYFCSGTAYDQALSPMRGEGSLHPTNADKRAAVEAANRNLRKLAIDQLTIQLRAEDVRQVYADPDRMAAEQAWNEYCRGVGSVAWSKGNGEAEFIRRWKDLVAARHDAEQYDDVAAVRSIDARLKRLTTLDWPVPATTTADAASKPRGRRQIGAR